MSLSFPIHSSSHISAVTRVEMCGFCGVLSEPSIVSLARSCFVRWRRSVSRLSSCRDTNKALGPGKGVRNRFGSTKPCEIITDILKTDDRCQPGSRNSRLIAVTLSLMIM